MHDIDLARLENKIELQRRGLHKVIDGVFDGLRAELCPDGPAVALELRILSLEADILHIKRHLRGYPAPWSGSG